MVHANYERANDPGAFFTNVSVRRHSNLLIILITFGQTLVILLVI